MENKAASGWAGRKSDYWLKSLQEGCALLQLRPRYCKRDLCTNSFLFPCCVANVLKCGAQTYVHTSLFRAFSPCLRTKSLTVQWPHKICLGCGVMKRQTVCKRCFCARFNGSYGIYFEGFFRLFWQALRRWVMKRSHSRCGW